MTTLKGLMMAAALLAGSVSLAMAQNGPATGSEPPVGGGAAASGSGYVSTPRTVRHHPVTNRRMYMQGSPAANAKASGGSGTHKGALKTGSASSNQKVLHNENGYK
jgi:predicted lipid-binding transport protein (Tim44 family)